MIRIVLTAILIYFGGCSTYTPAPNLGDKEYGNTLAVLTQICMSPDKTYNHMQMESANRYGNYGEMRSFTGVMTKLVGITTANEIVYEGFSHRRQIDIVSFIIRIDYAPDWANTIDYIYDVQKRGLSTERWSAWESPQSMNKRQDEVWHKLVHDRKFEMQAPTADAPKIRYRLVRTSDWWKKLPRQNDERPGCF